MNASLNKTYIWWKFLSLVALVNIAVWIWAYSMYADMLHFSTAQLVLSGCYVLVCAFRSFFPRIDLERYCLFDTPLSSIVLGRSLATLAELCFSAQVAILVHDLGHYLNSPGIVAVSYALVPIIVAAQLACWYATLTLNHFWHGIEEALWILMIALVAGSFTVAYFQLSDFLQSLMLVGIAACVSAGYIMLFVDIPMYFARTRRSVRKGHKYLALAEGMRDAWNRRVPTSDWAVWKHEVVWISAYFTVGVWLSIGMIFVSF